MKRFLISVICFVMIASGIAAYADAGFNETYSDITHSISNVYVDVDFEAHTLDVSAYTRIRSGSGQVGMNGKTIELRNFAGAVIARPEEGAVDDDKGKSLILEGASGSNIRSESGSIGTGVLVYEMDYAKATTDVSSTVFDGYFTNIKGNTNQPGGNVVFDAEGNIKVFGMAYGTYSSNKWYNIKYVVDCDAMTATVYIDDDFAGSKSIDTNGGFKEWYRTTMAATSGSVQYLDNLKIYTLAAVEPEFTVTPFATELVCGMSFGGRINVKNYPDAYEAELCVSEDGEGWETVATMGVDETDFSIDAVSDFFFKVILRDSDGNALSESDITSVSVKNTYGDIEKWNIDFEKHTLVGNHEKYIFLDGVQLKNENDTLHSNRNSMSADILIDKKDESSQYGKSLKLYTTNASDNMQLNEYQATLTGPVVVSEYDVCFESKNVNAVCMMWYYYIGNSQKTGPSLTAGNGNFSFNGNSVDFEVDKWYNLKMYFDTSSGVVSCYVDNCCIGVAYLNTEGFVRTQKLLSRLNNCENGVMWMDNYKVYETAFVPEITNVSSEGNIISVEFSEAIRGFESTDFFGAAFGENILTPKSWSFDGFSKNKINVECEEEIYTAVPIDISISSGDISLNFEYTSPAADFDVTDLTFTKTGSGVRANASLVGATGKNVVMILVAYNENGEIISVNASEKKAADVLSQLSCSVTSAAMCKVFFIESWQTGLAAKNVVYTHGG